jgi:FixJ family two-component response regulator
VGAGTLLIVDDKAQDMLREGVRGFVQKPYRIAKLLEKVLEALER